MPNHVQTQATSKPSNPASNPLTVTSIVLNHPANARAKSSPRGGGRYVAAVEAVVTLNGVMSFNVPVWVGSTPVQNGSITINLNVGKPDKSITMIDPDFSKTLTDKIESTVDAWPEWPKAYDKAVERLTSPDADASSDRPKAFQPRTILVNPKTGQRTTEPARTN